MKEKKNEQIHYILREKSLACFLRLWFSSINQCHYFRIEQLCPSTDSMISLVFVHLAIMLS